MVFIDMNSYLMTEGRNFKTFLKDNFGINLDSCYIFTKKIVEHEIEHNVSTVLMEFSYIRRS